MDWQEFKTAPHVGGLNNQPIRLMKNIRLALMTYNSLKTWRDASSLSAEAFSKFCSNNADLLKFMEYVWSLQDAPDG